MKEQQVLADFEKICKLKKDRGSTKTNQEIYELALSKGVKITKSSISKYLINPKPRKITMKNLEILAEYFDVGLQELIIKGDSSGKVKTKYNDDIVVIEYFKDVRVSAGTGIENFYSEIGYKPFTRKELSAIIQSDNFKNISMYEVDGNSMEPTIPNNSLVLFRSYDGAKPKESAIYIVYHQGELLIKRIATYPQIQLLSDNKDYAPRTINECDEFEIIGKVLGFIIYQDI